MTIKRNEKGNIEFTSEEFADFLCKIGNEITAKLNAELAKRITIEEATNAIIKDMGFIEPKLYDEADKNFNPFLFDCQHFQNKSFVVNLKKGE